MVRYTARDQPVPNFANVLRGGVGDTCAPRKCYLFIKREIPIREIATSAKDRRMRDTQSGSMKGLRLSEHCAGQSDVNSNRSHRQETSTRRTRQRRRNNDQKEGPGGILTTMILRRNERYGAREEED